ncbi:MAG: ATP-binding protein [Nevskia sp.]|jgi:hypothetical protein|nr:ATP-binding protein [Nevskia sp.]MCK9384149.1 ATP-binding protein [Nevskia sp.]
MAGSEAQAGFYYQNVIAAHYCLDLIEFGTPLRAATFDNPSQALYIDDVIATYSDSKRFVQIKWSDVDSAVFTLHNLASASDDESIPLLAKLAAGYRTIEADGGTKSIVLFSTKGAGTNRQSAKGFDKSLSEFVVDFHTPFTNTSSIDVRVAPNYSEYKSILTSLMAASGFTDILEFSQFLKCLRFELNQPDRDAMSEKLRIRMAGLGIDRLQYGALLDQVVNWSIEKKVVDKQDVLRALGLLDRFIDRVSHSFPVDQGLYVETPELFDNLDRSINSINNGFILVEGEPGSGKSTALSTYLSNRPEINFGYFCFVPGDTTLGNERLGEDAFVQSMCIGLTNAFPDVKFPTPFSPFSKSLFNSWLHYLSSAGRRVVFVVDGLDHVDRKARQSLIAQPLTSVLDGTPPPECSNCSKLSLSRGAPCLPPTAHSEQCR